RRLGPRGGVGAGLADRSKRPGRRACGVAARGVRVARRPGLAGRGAGFRSRAGSGPDLPRRLPDPRMSAASTSANPNSVGTILPAGAAIRVFLAFAGGYFMSYALRSVNAMISP